jgi:hypothetical protein
VDLVVVSPDCLIRFGAACTLLVTKAFFILLNTQIQNWAECIQHHQNYVVMAQFIIKNPVTGPSQLNWGGYLGDGLRANEIIGLFHL